MSDSIFIEGIDRLLLDFAEQSAKESAGVADTPWEHGGRSVTAIILAAAAVEAHVGEWLAEHGEAEGISKAKRDEWASSTLSVADIIKQIFREMDRPTVGSVPWFDELKALSTLRNHVVHYYPMHREPGTWPEKLAPYIVNGTLLPGGDDGMDWTSRLLVSSVARQALKLAESAIKGFDGVIAGAV